ncbi:MAG: class I SAM-dependent methyltransferase [Alphaproteobacteria bacterium]|nr:class I SAM-dependent methyltransferase [Alphaproteobacteria bacterium]
MQSRQGSGAEDGAAPSPRSTLDAEAVRQAYRRWASVYDSSFGSVSARSRRRAAEAVNALPGKRVLEVGVGTGLALAHYAPDRRITGIDLSAEMLARARERVAREGLANVEVLLEMDAEAMDFPDGAFDIAAAMFVASVVPHPRRLMAEMRRVVCRGGHLLFINHFMSRSGPRLWIERAMAPASRALGWHPDFAFEALFSSAELEAAEMRPAPPFGLFTLAHLPN